jgi:PHP family Zn ribbon phosphoesterase
LFFKAILLKYEVKLMSYIADLHLHSCYSRATSKHANLEGYYYWAQLKGIQLLGTGDFTHPQWYRELSEKLEPDGSGFYRLKQPPVAIPESGLADLPPVAGTNPVKFCLTAEISSIYKKAGATRKVHTLLFAPDLATVARINTRLAALGNIKADGRPILGLDPKILLKIIKDISPETQLVPAHIWTPWFSLFGSKSGFDAIEDCFEELTPEIFALETGLSSDPVMNWRWSALDRFRLISNSDAHSPQKLGREATVFHTDFNYTAMFAALKTGAGFGGTIEFYPEEGKYHLDGHRKCQLCLEPEATLKNHGLCPVCGNPLTIGVMHRVIQLADRPQGVKPAGAVEFL